LNACRRRGGRDQHLLGIARKAWPVLALDNLPAHKIAAVPAAIDAKGAQLFLLPPYSPDMNPIEMAFAESQRQKSAIEKYRLSDN